MFKPQRIEPKAGQESVWDYPRPPGVEKVIERLRVMFNRRTIADTRAGYRVLETSHPPVYYLPTKDTQMALLEPAPLAVRRRMAAKLDQTGLVRM